MMWALYDDHNTFYIAQTHRRFIGEFIGGFIGRFTDRFICAFAPDAVVACCHN